MVIPLLCELKRVILGTVKLLLKVMNYSCACLQLAGFLLNVNTFNGITSSYSKVKH